MYLLIYKDEDHTIRILECPIFEVALEQLRKSGGWIVKTVDLVEKKV